MWSQIFARVPSFEDLYFLSFKKFDCFSKSLADSKATPSPSSKDLRPYFDSQFYLSFDHKTLGSQETCSN